MRFERKTGWLVRRAVSRLAQPRAVSRVVPCPNGSAQGFDIEPAGMPWLIFYNADVLPEDDPALWTKDEAGGIEYDVANSILTVTDNSNGEYVYWHLAEPALDNVQGTMMQAWMRVTDGDATEDVGALMAVWDGEQEFHLWLRQTGLNVEGEADLPVDLSAWSRVTFLTRGEQAAAYVNGRLQQVGGPVGPTLAQEVAFGSGLDGTGKSTTDWDWLGIALRVS